MSKDIIHIQVSEKFRKHPSIVLCGNTRITYAHMKNPKGKWVNKNLGPPTCEACILLYWLHPERVYISSPSYEYCK